MNILYTCKLIAKTRQNETNAPKLSQVADIIESRRIISKYIKHNNFTVIPVGGLCHKEKVNFRQASKTLTSLVVMLSKVMVV